MDIEGALKAVEAIRGTVPEADQAGFDAELTARYAVVSEVAGVVAVEGALQADTEAETETPTLETKESLGAQLTSATKGYQEVVTALNAGRRIKNRLDLPLVHEGILAPAFELWLTEDKLAIVHAAQEADPNVRFTLIATPNIEVNAKDIAKIAKGFGANQRYETYVYDELYGKYSAEELSGTDPTNNDPVQFSLIPSTFIPEMTGTVAEQRAKLADLQATNPQLKVPSVLEAITYWNTLRATGDPVEGDGTFDKTYIRHFDLGEKRLGGWSDVPNSCVDDVGKPLLNRSHVQYVNDARLSVG